ncbi:MAG: DUF3616 domain-containing protein, partial [Chloroflexi bacterium]|nr:DUF3616 domain-containing protein [Chloroflexota bacterium]
MNVHRNINLLCLVLETMFVCSAHGQMKIAAQFSHSWMCDASAGVALDAQRFAAANDEDNVLRIYARDRSGGPLQTIDLARFLEVESKKPETDLEGAARIGDRVFWITSHGRNKDGKRRASRCRFFATQVRATPQGVELSPVGRPYKRLLQDLLNARGLGRFHLETAAQLAPKEKGALNIEGLCATPEQHLLIGFRNPIPQGKALLVPLLNPDEVIDGRPARLGEPIQLDLNGLGIRDLAVYEGKYVIIAGSHDRELNPRLYLGNGRDQPQLIETDGLPGLNPEAVIVYPDKGLN